MARMWPMDTRMSKDGSMPRLGALTEAQLLALHAGVIDELRGRSVVRTTNNPLGDYTEWLVCRALNLCLEPNSRCGYDAIDADGTRYQIKGRRPTTANPSRQLSAIRKLDTQDFDVLIAVIFDETYAVQEAWSIPHGIIATYARYREHVNAHILHIQGALLNDPTIERIDHLLRT